MANLSRRGFFKGMIGLAAGLVAAKIPLRAVTAPAAPIVLDELGRGSTAVLGGAIPAPLPLPITQPMNGWFATVLDRRMTRIFHEQYEVGFPVLKEMLSEENVLINSSVSYKKERDVPTLPM